MKKHEYAYSRAAKKLPAATALDAECAVYAHFLLRGCVLWFLCGRQNYDFERCGARSVDTLVGGNFNR